MLLGAPSELFHCGLPRVTTSAVMGSAERASDDRSGSAPSFTRCPALRRPIRGVINRSDAPGVLEALVRPHHRVSIA